MGKEVILISLELLCCACGAGLICEYGSPKTKSIGFADAEVKYFALRQNVK